MKSFVAVLVVLILLPAFAPTVRADDLNEEVERVKIRATLAGMAGEDQGLREGAMGLMQKGYRLPDILNHPELKRFAIESEAKNNSQLRKIFNQFGWIGISKYGTQASDNAWLICQHADHDLVFQEECLALVQKAADLGETSNSNMAFLWDRVLVNRNQLQKYGTQGACVEGKWVMAAAEEPAKLDERRKSVGLPSVAVYNSEVSAMCRP